ncbi:hypothetical protein QP952_07820 [Corynebacterium pseudodiphtheriticum]|uniref:hypothetical protein n=1 Tax=Corynebacterium pseudodiphtheriticum TaxID=37637 RepID=UPI00254A6309|nr:hypothetical protein [Corynebacterium pseudodiphtheriticum]MDK8709577.1 hypothetical protein [Corynebacterium pseudodiphtheriticum]
MEIKQWLSKTSHRRITDQEIADILKITRKTANKRLNEGLPTDDLLALCQEFGINRTLALVELGHVPYQDVLDFLDSDGALVSTADEGELAIELARRLNPATRANEIDELASRRSGAPAPDLHDDDDDNGVVRNFPFNPERDVADPSPEEGAGSPDDYEP